MKRLAPTASGPIRPSPRPAASRQLRWNQSLATAITALVRPKPSIARLTTSEPKWVQLPTANTRMMSICSAMTAPAPRPDGEIERQPAARVEHEIAARVGVSLHVLETPGRRSALAATLEPRLG